MPILIPFAFIITWQKDMVRLDEMGRACWIWFWKRLPPDLFHAFPCDLAPYQSPEARQNHFRGHVPTSLRDLAKDPEGLHLTFLSYFYAYIGQKPGL
jgi:hypothetical protein